MVYFTFSASLSIFSIKIPYPLVGSFTKTCVTAPTNFPFWIIGLPLTVVVNMGQHFFDIHPKISLFEIYKHKNLSIIYDFVVSDFRYGL